jgi:hypothetical protein
MIGSADAQFRKITPADATTIKLGTNTSFASLKQIDAGVLNVGYGIADTSNPMEGIHHESKPALAHRDARQRNRGSDRDLSPRQKRGAEGDARSGSITH